MALPVSVLGRGMTCFLVMGLGVVGSAFGQVSFELRTRLALGWGEQAVAIHEPLLITEPAVLAVAVVQATAGLLQREKIIFGR